MRFHRYAYYRFYKMMERAWKKLDDDPWIQAWLAYASSVFLNLYALVLLAERLLNPNWQVNDHFAPLMGVLAAMAIYFSLGSRDGMRAIVAEFTHEPPQRAQRNGVIALVYFILSFFVVLVEVIISSGVR